MADPQDRQSEAVRARRERGRQLREQHARRNRMRRWAIGGIGGAIVAVVVVFLGYTFIQDRQQDEDDEGLLGEVQTYQVTRNHTPDPVTYAQTPPVGGDHDQRWQNCGYYDAPLRNENAVHSLEHGAVWITYQQDLPAEQVAALREKANAGYILVSPYVGLPTPVVASAWGVQIQLDSANDPALDAFIRAYKQGPQTPEPGAACTSGIGVPL